MILGFVLRALLAAAVVGAVAATVVYVVGMITRSTLEEKIQDNGIQDAVIKKIDRTTNIVTLEALNSDKILEVHGDDISDEFEEGERIRI